MFFAGCLSFALFFLSDMNDLRFHKRELFWLFPLGFLLLTVSIVFLCIDNSAPELSLIWRIMFWVLFAAFLALEIYSLFFALPASESYASPGFKRPVCSSGVYALCRHPGVLWFFGAMVCLYFAAGLPLYAAMVFTLLDVALVIYEDYIVFPAVLSGYDEYRRKTPFLVPTPKSIGRCFNTL